MLQPALAAPVYAEVVVTADSAEVLTKLAHALVEERLVAYAYDISSVQAVYRKDGEVQEETQARVGLHTRATLVSEIVDRLDQDHPGDIRSVVATQLIPGRSDYLQWVADRTTADVDHHGAAGRRRAGRRQWSWSR